ncbi:MAG: hypothetical protein ABSD57_05240 [Verrucomicrobiota bacterium]|jgi:hypothetical protein
MPFKLTDDGERIQLTHAQIQRAMKPRDIFKDIFGLAVRLLGLVFLYFGLSAVPPLLDFGAIETAGRGDILNVILPVVFNLAVAWWLIGGGLLVRRAYPEAPRISLHPNARDEGVAPLAKPTQSQGTKDMETAEKKLASLVGKPKNGHAA